MKHIIGQNNIVNTYHLLYISLSLSFVKHAVSFFLLSFFNDIVKPFYLPLYGVRHMAKDHSDSERGNPLPQHGLLFSINSNYI